MLGRLFRGLPVLFTEHGRWFPDYPRRKRIVFNRLLLRRRDRVVGVGECVRQALVHNEGIRAHRVEVVYNGIETRAFPPRRVHRDQVRAELGCRPDEFVVIQVARLDYLKDHQTALRTLDRLVESVPAARLLLVGDGPERTAIEAEINCHQLWSNVSLLGTRHDVPRLLAAADVLLLTSISEGIPLTLLEAMAAGLPVVATRVGGVAEVVVDGETGLLAASGDDAALAAALRQLAQEPGLRQRLGACGCQRVRDHFDDAAMLTSYDQIYREMLGA
jgi:glycosyltransferase involved in cell wall biosynthesis